MTFIKSAGAGFWGGVFLAVFLSGISLGGTEVPAEKRFGTDYLWYGINPYYKEENVAVARDYLKDLRLTSLRVDVHWHFLEPSRDRYDWRMTDLIVNTAPPGTDLLFTLYSSAGWAVKDLRWARRRSTSNAPRDFKDYHDFVFALAGRYKGKVKYYQIENEIYGAPNMFWAGSREDYLELLKTASSAIRKADPAAKILPSSIALGDLEVVPMKKGPIPPKKRAQYEGAADFMREVFGKGCDYFDIADIHLYHTPDSIPGRLGWFKDFLSQHRCQKPIWVTETGGLDSRAYKNAKDNRLQAEDLVKRFASAFGNGAQRVFWLAIHRSKDRVHPIFGEIRLTDDPYAKDKKPGYYTLKLLVEKIEGFTSVSGIPDGYRFVVGGRQVLIVWADREKTVDLSPYLATPGARITHIVTDLDSGRKPVYPPDEVRPSNAVPLSAIPVFVVESKD